MMKSDKVSLLIVDDLPEKLLVLETVLAGLDEHIVTARSGSEALQHVLRQEFAVILMDVEMPGMDGLETAALIRQRRKSARTPIIFVTAFADDLRTTQGYSLGAVDYMLSPVVPEILRTKVKVFVDLYRMNREIQLHAEERVQLVREQAAREAAEKSAAALRESEERFRLASEAVNGFIYEFDPITGKFTVSRGMRDLMGFEPSDAMTLDWWDEQVRPEDLPGLISARSPDGDSERSPFHHQYRVRHSEGQELHVWDQGIVVKDRGGRMVRMIGNVVNVTEQKRTEQALAEANRRKDEFLSMLAHELRNPLAPIRNAVGLMKVHDRKYPELHAVREMIDRNILQLVRLVDDLLDISRINYGKIRVEREPIDLEQVVRQAIEIAGPLIEAKSHRFHLETAKTPVRVCGDLTRLTQVVANLLNNAAKYTESGGTIQLILASAETEAVIRVRDSGMGLSREMLESIFEPFIQVDRSLDRSEGGLGIGLTLARRLVEKHEGRVTARSEGLGKGSEFEVRIPLLKDDVALKQADSAPPVAETDKVRRRVMLVDDNVDSADTLALLLQIDGHDVRVCYSGPDAILQAAAYHPEVILLDIGLPEMDGYEVARRLRSQASTANVFLAALTGYGQEEDTRKALAAGFDVHLVKPIDPAKLTQLLADCPTER